MNERETQGNPVSASESDEERANQAVPSEQEDRARPGHRLAARRKAQGRSLTELSAALKLPRSVLEAIEEDRLDRIAPIYRRGYLVNYARELGEPVERYLSAEVDGPPPLTDVLPVARPPRTDRMLRFATYFLGTTLIVPPLVYLFITGGSRLFDGNESPASEASVLAERGLEDTSSNVTRRIARALALDPDASSSGSSDDGPLAASTLPLPALRPAGSEPVSEFRSAEPETADAVPAQRRVELKLLEDSWVEIFDATGARLEFDLLRAESSSRYEGIPPFRILLGRANAVRISLDGRDIDFEGSSAGGVVEFTLALPNRETNETLSAGGDSDLP